jgi:hypothetical protein
VPTAFSRDWSNSVEEGYGPSPSRWLHISKMVAHKAIRQRRLSNIAVHDIWHATEEEDTNSDGKR